MRAANRTKDPMNPRRALAAVAVLAFLAGCTTSGPTPATSSPSASALTPRAAAKLAQAGLLPGNDVSPAPPGDVMIDSFGPVLETENIAEPSRQVMTCTPLELPPEDVSGPAEPDALAAATSGFVTGVAQVDQYAVAYLDEAAAERAVTRARASADNCDAAFRVHSPDADANAVVTDAPSEVAGFQVHATYYYKDTKWTGDEVSAVLRAGRTVLYIRANETGSPAGMHWKTDGVLDAAWADQLVKAAAAHLAS